jgi:hypothetical protein
MVITCITDGSPLQRRHIYHLLAIKIKHIYTSSALYTAKSFDMLHRCFKLHVITDSSEASWDD